MFLMDSQRSRLFIIMCIECKWFTQQNIAATEKCNTQCSGLDSSSALTVFLLSPKSALAQSTMIFFPRAFLPSSPALAISASW